MMPPTITNVHAFASIIVFFRFIKYTRRLFQTIEIGVTIVFQKLLAVST